MTGLKDSAIPTGSGFRSYQFRFSFQKALKTFKMESVYGYPAERCSLNWVGSAIALIICPANR